ncbi:sigma factor-like helix-turn-helix DNA-binding protein [Demequina silvatica]|uniref:sigma factor-like helix-turn-helix DNA-binding protein n=1 Tax=Demequina silvatica TaxID=1638988 RepID=UPI000780D899|nr:sigma factor-like helix-turn-helix DNA-binding protein [Demequina silvatica]
MGSRSDALRAVTRGHGVDLLARARLLTGDDAAAGLLVERALAQGTGRGHVAESPDDATAEVRRALHRAFRRSKEPEPPLVERPAAEGADAPGEPDLREALRLLSRRERVALVLRYVDGMAATAIAVELDVSVKAVLADLRSGASRLAAERPDLHVDVEDAVEGGVEEELTVAFGARR